MNRLPLVQPPSPARLLTVTAVLMLLSAGAAPAQFALGLGSTASDEGRAVAVDAAGNVYVTGFFNGTVDFDPGAGVYELTASIGEACFTASYTADGTLRYARSFGGEGRGVVVDDEGNAFVTGEVAGVAVDVDPGPDEVLLNPQEGRVFLVSYDPSGDLRFGFNVGGGRASYLESGHGIALDALGNVFLTGVINDEADFDPDEEGEEMVEVRGNTDAFLASYSNDGIVRFAFALGGRFTDLGYDVTTDPGGLCHVSGTFRDTLDVDPGPELDLRVSAGSEDLFVASYTNDGDLVDAVTVGGSSRDEAQGVAVDADGNRYVTGWFVGDVDFDPGPGELVLASGLGEDCFLASYDAAGSLRFAFQLGNEIAGMRGLALALDDQDRPQLTGSFSDAVDFDPGVGEHVLSATNNAFVAGFDTQGAFRFAYTFEDVSTPLGDEVGRGIAVGPSGQTHVVGTFETTNDFDPSSGELLLSGEGSGDVFLARSTPVAVGVETAHPGAGVAMIESLYPNPTTGPVQVRLAVPRSQRVRVAVYDLAGRLVARLHDGVVPGGAPYTLEFAGGDLPSGLYLVKADDGRTTSTGRMLVVR
jgi:hypothetical protein